MRGWSLDNIVSLYDTVKYYPNSKCALRHLVIQSCWRKSRLSIEVSCLCTLWLLFPLLCLEFSFTMPATIRYDYPLTWISTSLRLFRFSWQVRLSRLSFRISFRVSLEAVLHLWHRQQGDVALTIPARVQPLEQTTDQSQKRVQGRLRSPSYWNRPNQLQRPAGLEWYSCLESKRALACWLKSRRMWKWS